MKQRTILAVIALLVGWGFATALFAGALPDPADPKLPPGQRLPALLERVKAQQQELRTLQAEFVQRRESELLAAPEETRGSFSFRAPDAVRWEYAGPKAMTVLIRGEQMTTWYRDLQRADKVNVGKYSAQVMRYLGASGSLESLQEYFNVRMVVAKDASEPFRLELEPRFERIAKRLRSMTLWIDRASYLPVRLRYVEADGDSTEYRFEKLQKNADLPPERFELDLPPGVKVRTIELGKKNNGQ